MTWYDDTTSLAGLLELVVQNYESDREEYWSEDSNDALLLELLDHVAQALVEASGDLLERSASLEGIPFDWSMIRRLADHPELKAQVLEKVQIDLGYDFVGRIDESAIRCLELTQTVLAESPPPSVAKYVRRLSRCYVNGFLPECVILCRAVVENSIRARYDRASIPLPASDKGSAPMRGQIEFAKRAKWITDDAASGALIVWQRGNTAVHNDPEATKDVLGTIRLTMRLLRELAD